MNAKSQISYCMKQEDQHFQLRFQCFILWECWPISWVPRLLTYAC